VPFPTPRIYITVVTRLVSLSLFDLSLAVSRLRAPVNRLWAPPRRLAYRRFFTPILEVFLILPFFDLAGFIPYIRPTQLARQFLSARYFQEVRNPIAYRHLANRNPIVN
jgi:hypothetical protein